ncbi:T9SS type A sorting domain-containing protein [Hymenobacter negativus]|uniref:T9SS type A sorting domain-containing protein n=1 Tax=Hymenobacter negativus TaxID=2795026 RepID=A0ABS3QPE9_9BACT|nr:T9SS type A sorting domain-containing protein [Hymenobacter negativus]MBO2012624.1 T9SS type A sorting domain-containing protein [Hymenobacter negativus]
MFRLYTLLLLVLLCAPAHAQYADPNYPKPISGYGSDGPHPVATVSFPNLNFLGRNIEVYYPADATGRVPTIFYSHAFGGNVSSNISGVLEFAARKGYAIVFVPYQTTGVTVADRYTNLLQGFRRAARRYPTIIDTTRVGFLGHSFGGGASFGNGLRCFLDNGWGQNGRFIYSLAPWYVYNLTPTELASFPGNTRLLVEIFNDDDTNDHRMAIDAFRNVNIPAAEKDFLMLRSDTLANHTYLADHVVPNTAAAFDALDYYAYYRLLDALCDYTFNGSLAGKNVALGHGSTAQVTMPAGLKPLISSSNPLVRWSQSKYLFPCNDAQNPRIQFCSSIVSATLPGHGAPALEIYPNPAATALTISGAPANQPVRVFNVLGSLVLTAPDARRQLAVAALPAGLYYLEVGSQRMPFQRE